MKEKKYKKKTVTWVHEESRATKVHHTARTFRFTPFRVNGAPPIEILSSMRTTECKFIDDDDVFQRTDNSMDKIVAHLNLGRQWIGSTRFVKRRLGDGAS